MIARRLPPALAVLSLCLVGACTGSTDPGEVDLTGEWCTLGSIGADGTALEGEVFMGPRLQQDGNEVVGTGQVKRRDSNTLWPSRFQGIISLGTLTMEVTPQTPQDQEGAPFAELTLEIQGENDLVGSAVGDSGLEGEITLVRLGQRCTGD